MILWNTCDILNWTEIEKPLLYLNLPEFFFEFIKGHNRSLINLTMRIWELWDTKKSQPHSTIFCTCADIIAWVLSKLLSDEIRTSYKEWGTTARFLNAFLKQFKLCFEILMVFISLDNWQIEKLIPLFLCLGLSVTLLWSRSPFHTRMLSLAPS